MNAAMRAFFEKELENKRRELGSLEREFEGWNVAVMRMATLRNRIRKLERMLDQQEQMV